MKTQSIVGMIILGATMAWASSAPAEIVAQYQGAGTFNGTSDEVTLVNVSIGQEGRVDLEFKPDGVAYGSGDWTTQYGTLWCLSDVPGGDMGQYRLQLSNDSLRVRLYSGAGGYAVDQGIAFTPTTAWHTASLAWKQGELTQLTVDGTTTTFANAVNFTAFTSTSPNHVVGATSANTTYYPSGFMSYFHGDMRNVVVQNTYSAVPEPSGLLLFATGTLGLLAYAWRTQR